jgi:hypothetical protein
MMMTLIMFEILCALKNEPSCQQKVKETYHNIIVIIFMCINGTKTQPVQKHHTTAHAPGVPSSDSVST